jgi:hypothetical protein
MREALSLKEFQNWRERQAFLPENRFFRGKQQTDAAILPLCKPSSQR